MKILTIIGARPQFIKAASLSREFSKYEQISEIIVHTGQHFDENMSSIFFDELEIPKPNYNLGINGGNHGYQTGEMIQKIEEVVLNEAPDYVLVYGDTNSTLAGAIVASKLNVNLIHVEAGLRSFNMKMPEEVNRILTDRVSNVLFCPTITAIDNLKNEGFDKIKNCEIHLSGDVMQDIADFYSNKVKTTSDNDYILGTVHRAENTNNIEKLKSIFSALAEISQEEKVILPLHPRTKHILKENNIDTGEICIIEPVGYLEMITLIKNCSFIMTDSGGLQKEAFFFKKYCITLRDQTEWVELVENKVNVLVGSHKEAIIHTYKNINSIFKDNFEENLYGNGNASKNIVKTLLSI